MPDLDRDDLDGLVKALGAAVAERTSVGDLEITIDRASDGLRIWVHADGQMVGRFYRVARLVIDDRTGSGHSRSSS
jgi:hypothetical protein